MRFYFKQQQKIGETLHKKVDGIETKCVYYMETDSFHNEERPWDELKKESYVGEELRQG